MQDSKKRHRCKEQTFGLCGRRQRWGDLREQHWNTYIIICETDRQVQCMRQVLRAGALGWPWGMGWEGRWEGGLGWGTHVHPWLIHLNVLQKPLQYFKVISLQLKLINLQKKFRISKTQMLLRISGWGSDFEKISRRSCEEILITNWWVQDWQRFPLEGKS